MSGTDSRIVGFLILTPIAILVLVVFGAIKLSASWPGRWKLSRIWRKAEPSHKSESSDTSSDSTGTKSSTDLETGVQVNGDMQRHDG